MDHSKINRQLTIGIVLGLTLGLIVAKVIPDSAITVPFVEISRLVGNVFVMLLKMVAVPLVFFSIFVGVTSLGDIAHVGSLGKKTILFYFGTTSIAVVIGLTLVNIIQPGVGLAAAHSIVPDSVMAAKDQTVISLLLDQVGKFLINPFEALAKGTSAMIGIILSSIFFGIGVLLSTFEKKQLVIDFMAALNDVTLQLTLVVLRLAPIGVFGILVRVLYDKRDALGGLVEGLGWFALTSFLALFIHGVFVIPLLVKKFSTVSIREFFSGISEPMKVAFGTDSSLATMPVTISALENRFGLSKKTIDFVVPLGATMNMDGTALYEAICAIFIAQALGIELTAFQQFIVFITAMIASVGAAGIPSAGLVTLVIVLNAVGIPYDLAVPYIGMIFTIDRFIDMCRTMVNVEGDCAGSLIIDQWMQNEEKNRPSSAEAA